MKEEEEKEDRPLLYASLQYASECVCVPSARLDSSGARVRATQVYDLTRAPQMMMQKAVHLRRDHTFASRCGARALISLEAASSAQSAETRETSGMPSQR